MECWHRLKPLIWSSYLPKGAVFHIQSWKARYRPRTRHMKRHHLIKTDRTWQCLLEVLSLWMFLRFSRIWCGLFHLLWVDFGWTKKNWLDKCPDWKPSISALIFIVSTPRLWWGNLDPLQLSLTNYHHCWNKSKSMCVKYPFLRFDTIWAKGIHKCRHLAKNQFIQRQNIYFFCWQQYSRCLLFKGCKTFVLLFWNDWRLCIRYLRSKWCCPCRGF